MKLGKKTKTEKGTFMAYASCHVLASAYVSARTVIDHWGEENRNGNKQYWFYIWGGISSKTDFFHVWKGNSGIF